MSRDVDCEADKEHLFQQKSSGEVQEEEEEEGDKEHDYHNIKLLAVEELVPISQSLITPSLAKLFNLNLMPQQQPFVEAILSAETSQYDAVLASKEELQLMQLQEGFCSSRAQEEDSRLSADDPCLQIMMDPFVDLNTSGATLSHKRSQLNAGLEGFNMQLGDGNDDHAEGFGMNHLLDRENSSNSAEGAGSGGGCNGGGSARTLKRPRLVWTPQLHKRFVDAVSHLGIKNAVPKTIMQLMNVDGLTRENVASHLQKYRLYLRRVHQGNLFAGCANSPSRSILGGLDHHPLNVGAPLSPAGSSDHLFSSSSLPASSLPSNSHMHHHHPPAPINPLAPSHMQSLLMQQPQHHLTQALPMIKSPPLHFNPHRFAPNGVDSNCPTQRPSWPSPHSSYSDINVLRHMESQGGRGPPSPPRQPLTLFPH